MYRVIVTRGFALAQALFFMMFLMAAMSLILMVTLQQTKRDEAERMAVDAYPIVKAFLTDAQSSTATSVSGTTYFSAHPLSSDYCSKLVADGLISSLSACTSGAWSANLTFSKTT